MASPIKQRPRAAGTRRASRYTRKSQQSFSVEDKLRLHAEIELFRRITQLDIPSEALAPQQFFELFCSKIQKCQSNLLRLSVRGLPAWLILFEFFRYDCTLPALSRGSRKFKDQTYWLRVSDRAQKLIEETRNVPPIMLPDGTFLTPEWLSPLNSWLEIVRKSYLVDATTYILYSVTPSWTHFVCPGYLRRQAKRGRGRKSKSADEDLTYLAVVLQGYAKRLVGKSMDRDVAEILCVFFEFTAGSQEHRFGTLRSRVDYFRRQHGRREIDKMCNRSGTEGVQEIG